MLTSFQVQNFKAFEDTHVVTLKPLTLFAGINSAGKSSLTQALLLLKQTLDSPSSLALAPGKDRLLQQSLGENFSDFVFGRPDLEKATLSYTLTFGFDPDEDGDLYADIHKLLEESGQDQAADKITATLQLVFKWGAFGYRGRPTIRVAELHVALQVDALPLVGLAIQPAGGMYRVAFQEDQTASFLKDLAYNMLEIDGLSNFLPDSLIISSQLPLSGKSPSLVFVKLFRDSFAAMRRDLSTEIFYLNSFREPPSRIYTTGQTSAGLLEPDGHNFAEVLWLLREEPVTFVHPENNKKSGTLAEITDYVLREVLQLKQPVRVEPAADGRPDIVEVKIDTLGPHPFPVTLADVGLGYNQILPVVIQGLLTPPGGLVIFEQPEIHLHPDVQAKLILFFIGLAKSGRRVLVETHSSYMIDHLCLAIAQDQGSEDWLAHHASVLFVHPPDQEHPGARIESVQIDPYGHILNWPPHFMPDTAGVYEAILSAGFAKRRVRQATDEAKV